MNKLTHIDEEGAVNLAEDITTEYMKSLRISYSKMLDAKKNSGEYITAKFEVERSENMLRAITGCLIDVEPIIQQTKNKLKKEWEVSHGKTHWTSNNTC